MKKTILWAMPVMAAMLLTAGCHKDPGPLPDNEIPAAITEKNAASRFNYDNWRKQTTIEVYNRNTRKCDEVNLPWASVTSATIPQEYKHPEKEVQADGTTPRWQLAFNFCDIPTLPGNDMFGLWDSHSQTMRIYTYIEQMPNPNAKSCFYQIKSSAKNYIDPYSYSWMPDSTTLATCNWAASMGGGLPTPSLDGGEILPITGTLDGEVNPGWICFEMHFSTGVTQVDMTDNISFSLLGIQSIAFTGKMDIKGALESNGGKITIPGNKTKVASGFVNTFGSLFSSLASSIAQGMKAESVPLGLLGGAGAVTSFAGGVMNALQEGKDKTYSLDLNFNISATAEINGSLSSNLGTTVPPTQVDYSVFFGDIISHSKKAAATKITTGLWNLKHAPVIYQPYDAQFCYGNLPSITYDGHVWLNTPFLDPTSVELILNDDNILFPLDEVEKVRLLSYDFMFTEQQYSLPVQPYYDYYGITRETGKNKWFYNGRVPFYVSRDYARMKELMLDPDAVIVEKDHLAGYWCNMFGTETDLSSSGLGTYNLIYSPLSETLADFGVAVVMEICFKNGDSRIFADRFIPEIRQISYKDCQALYEKISQADAPNTIAGVPFENALFAGQKSKALSILQPLAEAGKAPFRVVSYYGTETDNKPVDAIVVKECPGHLLKGIAIRTEKVGLDFIPDIYYSNQLIQLRSKLAEINDWDTLDARLAQYGMFSLDNNYNVGSTESYNIRKGTKDFALSWEDGYLVRFYEIDEYDVVFPRKEVF